MKICNCFGMVWLEYNIRISPIQGLLFPTYTLPYSRVFPKLYLSSFPNDCLPIIGMFLRNAYAMYQKSKCCIVQEFLINTRSWIITVEKFLQWLIVSTTTTTATE